MYLSQNHPICVSATVIAETPCKEDKNIYELMDEGRRESQFPPHKN